MLNLGLSEEVKIDKVLVYTATGTTTINTDEVDMQGYDGVVFIASVGSSAADVGMKVQQDIVTGMSGAADLEGSKQLLDGTQKQIVVDIHRPLERFVRAAVIRATTTTIEAVWAIRYRARNLPVTNTNSVLAAKRLVSPAEGTA